MTSCQDRRLDEYERLDWWDYIGAKTRSPAYQKLLAGGLTRSLNACKATLASTKTIGDILVQLMLDMLLPGVSSDRLLNGPTNTVWIEPWLTLLRSRGVVYQTDVEFECINMKNGLVESVTLSSGGKRFDVSGDYYVCAIPLERMVEKLTDDVLAADPSLKGLKVIQKNVQWMNGIQFYLNQDIPIIHGHCSYVDTAWALTSVSQAQFWSGFPMTSSFGNGSVRGILSVDISEWEVKGSQQYTNCKTARECTHLEIAQETWFQLKESLNSKDKTLITDDMLHSWFLDPDIIPIIELYQDKPAERDSEPLLVNYINSWAYRPDAYTRIPNLFLASDYVRTFTDLATMEGANEAARRATNAIINESGVHADMCKLWNLHEPDFLKLWRASDEYRYKHGLPWNGELNLLDSFKSFVGA